MGPLVYTSGNLDTEQGRAVYSGSFNGAAGLHQRKPTPTGLVVTTPAPLQWGRWFTPAETRSAGSCRTRSSTCFNGAAGLHQRKLGQLRQDLGPLAFASMGPLVYTSGNEAVIYHESVSVISFNGAAGLHQRKRRLRLSIC